MPKRTRSGAFPGAILLVSVCIIFPIKLTFCENLEILNTHFLTHLEESLGKCAATWQLFNFIWFDIAVRYGNIFSIYLGNKLMNDITYPWNYYDAQIVWSRNVLNVQYTVLITHSEVLNNFFLQMFQNVNKASKCTPYFWYIEVCSNVDQIIGTLGSVFDLRILP